MPQGTTYARRYAKACDACHKKKIRCNYGEPACELCTKLGQPCKFTKVEKSMPKRPRRGKYLSALEERMKTMESLLQQSKEKEASPPEQSKSSSPDDVNVADDDASTELSPFVSTTINGEVYPPAKHLQQGKALADDLKLPSHEEATHLAQGFFASHNHNFPIFPRERFLARLRTDYPPDAQHDIVWHTMVLVVLTSAHRLRAMSTPQQAEAENLRACPYFHVILDRIPRLTYAKPSLEVAQLLLASAAVMRGTAMPHHVPMLTATAIRMLQAENAHLEEVPGTPEFPRRTERICTFWAAYIMDKDISLQFRKPPVLYEGDIGRMAQSREVLQQGVVFSLDGSTQANMFAISQGLAMLQGQVWSWIYGGSMAKSRESLEAAQKALNPALAAWKDGLPFRFHRDDLVGRWPKHAIVCIVTLHFRYFHTLVELNKEPPYEPSVQLRGACPLARSLPEWPHSTSLLAVEAARDALDLAALTPRGNFQNVWMFFDNSLSAMLTLLVNGIVRPLDDRCAEDVRRVDVWLRVIDVLATESERPDLQEKKDFILHMRTWTMKEIEAARSLREANRVNEVCTGGDHSGIDDELLFDTQWVPDFSDVHADIFPLPLVDRGFWEPWSVNNQAWTMNTLSRQGGLYADEAAMLDAAAVAGR